MPKTKDRVSILFQAVGAIGSFVCLVTFIREPSFPTPDKLIVFLFLFFLASRQATAMLKRLGPFVVYIFGYELFRGLARTLNHHVDYSLAPTIDKLLFGNLPTVYLQNWLWHGRIRWYDYVLYVPYMLYFVLPFALAILIWKTRPQYYWQFLSAYALTYFGGMVTYIFFPAAPPWLASDQHVIQPIHRISSDVWASLGIHDFPSLYNNIIAPNPVAAVPSLHAACSTLFSIIIFKLYGRAWGAVSLIYPALIYFGVVYQGEHYVFDVLLGAVYAIAAYKLAPRFMRFAKRQWAKVQPRLPDWTHLNQHHESA